MKEIIKQHLKEFGPPLALAVIWFIFTFMSGFDKNAAWLSSTKDFFVVFFMISWFLAQYNRIVYQIGVKEANRKAADSLKKLLSEVGVVKSELTSVKQMVADIPSQPAAAQPEQLLKISEIINSANNHVDAISATVNSSIGDFTLNAQATLHSNT